MRRSSNRIIVSHAGTLPRPPDLQELMMAGPDKAVEFQERLPEEITKIVRRQAEAGVDVVNDGELGKTGGFNGYIRQRMSGISQRPLGPRDAAPHNVNKRDALEFPGAYAAGIGAFGRRSAALGQPAGGVATTPFFCTEPLKYVGQENVATDIARLKAAVQGLDVEPYLPAIAPGTIEHWLWNEHYPNDEAFLFAIADVLHEEYKAITDAGIVLQIDDPDLPDGWQMYPEMSVADYRAYAELRVEAMNRALRGVPEHLVRLHICWGSQHGPHKNDVPLGDIVDIVLKVNAECYSVEAANPRHDHEVHVWETVKLPAGKSYMPGVAGHTTDVIEHPRLIADRLLRYAKLMGRENVIAGTDCGIGSRVGHAEIAWAKLEAMAEGARLATKELWGRS
ncbi:MAG: cobalamin-independent methionine synthase II family protein [Chloroflexota bacterium]